MLFLFSPTTAIWQRLGTDCCRDSTGGKSLAVREYGFNSVLKLKPGVNMVLKSIHISSIFAHFMALQFFNSRHYSTYNQP